MLLLVFERQGLISKASNSEQYPCLSLGIAGIKSVNCSCQLIRGLFLSKINNGSRREDHHLSGAQSPGLFLWVYHLSSKKKKIPGWLQIVSSLCKQDCLYPAPTAVTDECFTTSNQAFKASKTSNEESSWLKFKICCSFQGVQLMKTHSPVRY